MAVLAINQLFTSRGGKDTFEKHRTYTRMYEVICDDSLEDDESTIGAAMIAAGVSLGTPYPSDPFAYVTEFEVEGSADSPSLWYVTVHYDSNPPLPSSVDPDGATTDPSSTYVDSPLDKPISWRYSSIDVQEPMIEWRPVDDSGNIVFAQPPFWTIDTNYSVGDYVLSAGNAYRCTVWGTSSATGGGPIGNGTGIEDGTVYWDFWSSASDIVSDPNQAALSAVANSAGFPFDPPAMETVSKPLILVTKNVPILTLPYLMTMKNAVNATTWRGIPPRCAKVLKIEAESAFENGVAFVKATWEIALDPDTHDSRFLDCGKGNMQEIPGGSGAKTFVVFKDAYGQPYTDAFPLDGEGNPLDPIDPPVYIRGVSRQTKIVDFNANLPF